MRHYMFVSYIQGDCFTISMSYPKHEYNLINKMGMRRLHVPE